VSGLTWRPLGVKRPGPSPRCAVQAARTNEGPQVHVQIFTNAALIGAIKDGCFHLTRFLWCSDHGRRAGGGARRRATGVGRAVELSGRVTVRSRFLALSRIERGPHMPMFLPARSGAIAANLTAFVWGTEWRGPSQTAVI